MIQLVLLVVELSDGVEAIMDDSLDIPVPIRLRKVDTCPSDNSFHGKHDVEKEGTDWIITVHVLVSPLKGGTLEQLELEALNLAPQVFKVTEARSLLALLFVRAEKHLVQEAFDSAHR